MPEYNTPRAAFPTAMVLDHLSGTSPLVRRPRTMRLPTALGCSPRTNQLPLVIDISEFRLLQAGTANPIMTLNRRPQVRPPSGSLSSSFQFGRLIRLAADPEPHRTPYRLRLTAPFGGDLGEHG